MNNSYTTHEHTTQGEKSRITYRRIGYRRHLPGQMVPLDDGE